MNDELKRRIRSDLECVQEILQEWDPIGVIDILKADGLPPNEYDGYAPEVLAALGQGADEAAIVSLLGDFQVGPMGLSRPQSEKDAEIARKLLTWWRTRGP